MGFPCQRFSFIRADALAAAVLVVFSLLPAQARVTDTAFSNMDEIAQRMNFVERTDVRSVKTVKIAVLDNGFKGYQAALGKTLPASTVFKPGPVAVDPATEDPHGFFMAQIVAGLLDRLPGVTYELHLYSTFGYSNLEAAVNDVIAQRMDVVLYAQVWEFGGNGDGRGFINALVNKATSAGVTWVNAAGNFGDSTYRGKIEKADDGWVKLPGPNNAVRVRCEKDQKNTTGKCKLRAVLSWNDFKDDVKQGTEKDLDLILTDDTLKIVQTAGLKQKLTFPDGEAGSSLYPREILQAEVSPGVYFLRVKMRSENFGGGDELRIVTSGEFTKLVDATKGETLLPPADNSSVITVGASDSEKSSVSQAMKKPELSQASSVLVGEKEEYKGSSNSSAMVAAAVAVIESLKPDQDNARFIFLLGGASSGTSGPIGKGLPLQLLQFGPTGQGCFVPTQLPVVTPATQPMLATGAVPVLTTAGIKIFVGVDPFQHIPGAFRSRPDDMMVASLQGLFVAPRAQQMILPSGAFEVVQMPKDVTLCGFKGNGPRSGARLPDLGAL